MVDPAKPSQDFIAENDVNHIQYVCIKIICLDFLPSNSIHGHGLLYITFPKIIGSRALS